ncbi:MAG: hypothetical protein JWO44_966 [Bacteroidetes bacterium]|nr:hypothetical protein [Bacteroidota bacterium]
MQKNNPKDKLSQLTDLVSLNNEDTILIDYTAVDVVTGRRRVDDCASNLKFPLRSFNKYDELMDVITFEPGQEKYEKFYALFKSATTLATNIKPKYVTGLKMNLGIDISNNKLCLLYQPVGIVESLTPNPQPNEVEYAIIEDEDDYYYYDGTQFKSTTDKSSIVRYTSTIELKHKKNAAQFEKFKKYTDVESIIFSFQEIFAVIYYNNTSNNISIVNAIHEDVKGSETFIQHSLLLAPEGVHSEKGILTGVYANLANLCPPNCHKITYTLE